MLFHFYFVVWTVLEQALVKGAGTYDLYNMYI